MPKLPFLEDTFVNRGANPPGKLTAVRLVHDRTLGTFVFLEDNDVVHGTIWQGGAATPHRRLQYQQVPAGGAVTFTVQVQQQGSVVVAPASWSTDCDSPVVISLGTLLPIDTTTDDGMAPQNPAARQLYWAPLGGAARPSTNLTFTFDSSGMLSWRDRGVSGQTNLAHGITEVAPRKETHLILLVRNGETGSIACSVFPNQTELKV